MKKLRITKSGTHATLNGNIVRFSFGIQAADCHTGDPIVMFDPERAAELLRIEKGLKHFKKQYLCGKGVTFQEIADIMEEKKK